MHSRQIPPYHPQWKIFAPAFWLAFLVWVGLLMYVSSQPGKVGPEHPILYIDKVQHLVFFAGGAMAFGAAIRATFAIRWATLFLVVIVTLSFLGLADEIHQLFVTGRSGGDPFDWLADLIGTSTGLAFLRKFYAKRPRENPGTPEGN